MIDINSTFWIQLVNFVVLMLVLNVILYKPILSVMEKRKQHLQGLDDEVKSLEETVDRKVADYEEKLRQARLDAMNERNEIQRMASDEGKAVTDEARQEIAKLVEGFKKKMNKEMADVRKVLKSQAEKISVEISEKVLGRSIQ
jgi:F-type H+-transporting ATPase subunit b